MISSGRSILQSTIIVTLDQSSLGCGTLWHVVDLDSSLQSVAGRVLQTLYLHGSVLLLVDHHVVVHVHHDSGGGHAGVIVSSNRYLRGGHAPSVGLLINGELPGTLHIVWLFEWFVVVSWYLRSLGWSVGRGVSYLGFNSSTVNILEVSILKLCRELVSGIS